MGILGSAIGGALGIGGAIFGGIKASKAMKRAKGMVEEQRRENEAWYNGRVNEDGTQRADAQRILTMLGDNIRERNRQAAGTQAVMGGTEEAVAAAKAANSAALADATSQIAAAGSRRRDQVEAAYLQNKRALDERLVGLETGRAQAIGEAAQGVAQAGAGIADFL